jgi:hypothetical protein
MPNRKPLIARRRRAGATRLTAAATIAFSLTFVAAGVAMLMGVLPQRMMFGLQNVDATVLLLFVPLCALTFAILAEAVRAATTGSFRTTKVRTNPLEPWRPGQGEG